MQCRTARTATPSQRCGGARLRGFSLIEFTAVLALMALIAGIVTLNVRYFVNKGKQDTVRVQIATVQSALEAFYNAESRYPTNDEGLAALAAPLGGGEALLPKVPADPWGRPFQYNNPGINGAYDVICLGADGREGGDGIDADISSNDEGS